MNLPTLLQYNFRVLMLGNWWLLVFPIAVSQLSVFWNVLTQQFAPTIPSQQAELISPLLAAFLGAHLLSPEYRSRVGAVLASRPVNIAWIVVLRLAVMLAVVWGLAILSLTAYSAWMTPFDIGPMFLAGIPSTLFLSMLSLTFATLFRNALAGFAVAAVYWLVDLAPGAPINPYLSLKSLTSYYSALRFADQLTFVQYWAAAKWALLGAAILLYLLHSRLVFGLGSPQTLKSRRRAAVAAGALIAVYILSGAVLKAGYGYMHRGKLAPNDLAWFRYQFEAFGPLPVASLFGPAFPRYIGEFTNPWRISSDDESDQLGDTTKHREDLRWIVERAPTSVWAPSAAEALARLESRRQVTADAKAAPYRAIVERFPNSPYVEGALRQIARSYADAEEREQARAAYQELLRRVPNSRYREEAQRFLSQE